MKRTVMVFTATVVIGAAAVVADAHASGRRGGIIGGMSAAEVMAWPHDPYYGAYPSYPAGPASYARPDGPPPGCVIRRQRVWDGYRWSWRKLRICH